LHAMVLLVAASLQLSGAPARGSAAEPVRIGVSGPFTGGSASMGISMRNGMRLAAQQVNQAGGVLGRPLLLVERDDQARNERGVQVAQELIHKEHVAATLGYVNTGVALASQRLYQDARIPVITSVATGSAITRQFAGRDENYIFRTSAPDTLQAPAIVAEALDGRGLRRPAILADSTSYGQSGREELERALAARGVPPVSVEKFNVRDVDMTAQLLKARQAGADGILTYGIGPELAQVVRGMRKLAWQVPVIGSWTLSMAGFIDNAGAAGNGVRMPQTFIQQPSTPRRDAVIAADLDSFRPRNGRIESAVAAAQGYDAVLLLAAAIAQAGSTEGPALRAALEDLQQPVAGIVATYHRPFSPARHEAITAGMLVMGEVRAGRVVHAPPRSGLAASPVGAPPRTGKAGSSVSDWHDQVRAASAAPGPLDD
jgi:branched-chain amino acid transport system substrate-binding protein